MDLFVINSDNEYTINNVIENDDHVTITGSAAHFGAANLNGQIVDSKSFENSIKMFRENVIIPALNYNHDSNALIGGITDLYTTDSTLEVEAKLNKNIPLVRDMILPLISDGTLRSFSTEGYISMADCKDCGNNTYYTPNFSLRAIAIVSVPADHESRFTIRNYFDDQYKLKNIIKYYFF